jgi:phospholipid/cholesterol/gamma-HCH transport system permease protein
MPRSHDRALRSPTDRPARLDLARDGQTLVLKLSGAWSLHGDLPEPTEVEAALRGSPPRAIAFADGGLDRWDTGLLTFVSRVSELGRRAGVEVDRRGLPAGVGRLLGLAEAVPERKGARQDDDDETLLEVVGEATIEATESAIDALAFIGDATRSVGRLFTRRARFRTSDLFVFIQQAGAEALPIVTLISFLVGLILAFVGAIQLQQFGATIYVANLVGIAMVREMGAMMTAIVMAGRTGASYAAQLGSMKVTQEIDSLVTMGISPMEFLVLPRMLALFLMMPLLCLYSDFVGILGGAAVSVGMLNLSAVTYYQQTVSAVTLTNLIGGVFKAAVYGILIAIAGCLRGMDSGNSSSAVGEATTAAVVTSIVAIVVACGIFAVVFYVLGI